MTEKNKIKWVYGIVFAFIAINTVLIANEFYWAATIPVAIIVLLIYIFSLDKLILLITFLTPLAINVKDIYMGYSISLPTEPLMFGVLVIFIFKLFYDNKLDYKVLKHPISISIFLYLFWMFITSITSQLPIVSFKFIISRLWFIVPFYFIGTQIFKDKKNIRKFFWLYTLPLLIVIGYTIINHSKYGFLEEPAHWVMTPFYNDHTAYGAAISLFIPIFFGLSFDKHYNKNLRIISFIVFSILIVAIILSFSRAAWISLIFAFIVYLFIVFKIKFRWILTTIIIITAIFFSFKFEILDKLEKNKQDSSTNFIEHIESISNISSDASNLERINRWQSAIRMFKEKPFLGWGPGTYQFEYAPFQQSKEKTIISTNAGNKGNAHSEYLGPLAEEGFIGMLAVFAIIICTIYTALRIIIETKNKEIKLLTLIVILSLITYYSHGFLNNFLDTDKASVPFWGLTAIIVAIDIYHHKKISETNIEVTD
ncbi:MAG: O-antigen ligase family protein [Bacteroidales bacterium]|nr:O-antigen ligase family protein [Bacteroidales bacterium]